MQTKLNASLSILENPTNNDYPFALMHHRKHL